ncbi:exosporium glycoprotein BclB-related protein [Paenibacillus sp. NEAU-GSW1]|uniref:exosporium glycoprotein BclB-related protein n=1 Tax=Paenibacillus sp. NEAU-GSW1 TaxID=2682486 RepID=UPI0020A6B033|nr:exosporium glycoprotein BclB-related protein [Paenibacillus sp. NEAU-GSW1]
MKYCKKKIIKRNKECRIPRHPKKVRLRRSGVIIPFASGTPVTMESEIPGALSVTGLVGFGNSCANKNVLGGPIDITGAGGALRDFAFSVPQKGSITSIAAYFSTTTALALGSSSVLITAQLYASSIPDNIFTPIPEAVVTLAPTLTGTLPLGTIAHGIKSGLCIPVTPETRLLMVFSAKSVGDIPIVTCVSGYASAGIMI